MVEAFDGILSRDQIRTLMAIVEQGSFYRAATELGVRQPAVTQLVKRLEGKLERRLFDRTPTGVTLTLDGEAVLTYARAMSKLGADMSRYLRNTTGETAIRIGIGEEFSRTSLPAVLALFSRIHTGFRFEAVCVIPSTGLFEVLDNGGLDVVVARRDPTRRSGTIVLTEPTHWIGQTGVPLPLPDPIPLVLPSGNTLRTAVLQALSDASRPWRVVFEGGSLAMLEAAVGAGLGIAACTARTKLFNTTPFDETANLPTLPPSTFVLDRGQGAQSGQVHAFCEVLETAASLSFDSAATAINASLSD